MVDSRYTRIVVDTWGFISCVPPLPNDRVLHIDHNPGVAIFSPFTSAYLHMRPNGTGIRIAENIIPPLYQGDPSATVIDFDMSAHPLIPSSPRHDVHFQVHLYTTGDMTFSYNRITNRNVTYLGEYVSIGVRYGRTKLSHLYTNKISELPPDLTTLTVEQNCDVSDAIQSACTMIVMFMALLCVF